jgi:heptosyltransferase-3
LFRVKILAIKFKLLGDVAVWVPALRALREHWPEAELHALVRQEAAPALQNLPWLDRVWAFPRSFRRGAWRRGLGLVRQLRGERFDRSIDFEGNDRGAFLSRLVGAPIRLGSRADHGFLGRRLCYTECVEKAPNGVHEVVRDLKTLEPWGIGAPSSLFHETRPDARFEGQARALVPEPGTILAHLSTSQPKKEWPLEHWVSLAQRAQAKGWPMVFSSGVSERERQKLSELRRLKADVNILDAPLDLPGFIAVLARAAVFISGDTGPLHLAAGLGVPCLGLFGPSHLKQWLPLNPCCLGLDGGPCACDGRVAECQKPVPCMASISVETVWERVISLYERDC